MKLKRIAVVAGVGGLLAFGGVAMTGGTAEAATNVCGNSVNVGTIGHPATSGGSSGQTCVNGQVKGNTGNVSVTTWLSHFHL